MYKSKAYIVFVFHFFLVNSICAQEDSYRLRDIWRDVELNYEGVKGKNFNILSAKANEKFVNSKALPQAKLQIQNTYGTFEASNGGFFPQNGLFNVSSPVNTTGSGTAASTFGSTTVEYEIYTFGQQKFERKAAKTWTLKSENEKNSYLLQLKKELSKRYINLIYCLHKLELADKNSGRLHDIQVIAGALSRSGITTAADSLLASSSYVQSLADRDRWVGLKNASEKYIDELYGKPIGEIAPNEKQFTQPEPLIASTENSLVNHPYMDVLGKESEYLKTSKLAILRSSLPSLKVLGGYAYRTSGIDAKGYVSSKWTDGFANPANNFLLGVGLTWNLTDIVGNRHKANSIASENDKITSHIRELKLNLESRSNAVDARLEELHKELQKTNEGVWQASQAYNMYMARYKNGLISLPDLLQTRLLLENAENRNLEASNEYWLQIIERSELQANFTYLFNNF